MEVRCIKNRIDQVQEDARFFRLLTSATVGYKIDRKLDLTVGKNYVVYGVSIRHGYPWFFVADDIFTSYPMAYPAPMFDLVDNRLSRHWRFGYFLFNEYDAEPMSLITFPEWASDYSFYERLLDSSPQEKALFHNYKELMDSEFSDDPAFEI